MCGICGIMSFKLPVEPAAVKNMCRCLQHRGDNGNGVWVDKNIVLGHQRLAIIDLYPGANQPFINKRQNAILTFNGEIYNFKDLKKQVFPDFSFRTHSDTEVLAELLSTRQNAALQLLNGMFAFAFYDRQSQKLTCARDRLGIKPFYYSYSPGNHFIFASEVKALLATSLINTEIDRQALSDYLSLGYIPGERTIYKQIKKLLPGQLLEVDRHGNIMHETYWAIENHIGSESADPAAILDHLRQAINLRLVSDVPVATFLSGGIDSSAISKLTKQCNYNPDCFSIGFHEKSFDESSSARDFAQQLNLKHYSQLFNAPEPDVLQSIAGHIDQPFADTSLLPTFQLCQNAAQKTRVVLSGDGGDEVFGGYETCRADLLQLMLFRQQPLSSHAVNAGNLLASLIPADRGKVSTGYKVKQFFAYCMNKPARAHYSWRLYFDESEKQQLLYGQPASVADSFTSFAGYYRQFRRFPVLKQHTLVDLKTWLADDILFKADMCSMAHGLELRTPFLDHRLLLKAFSLPSEAHFNLFKTKTLLKAALENVLPARLLKRKKSGFNCPVSTWLENDYYELMRDNFNNKAFKELIPGQNFIESLLSEHKERKRDNGFRLWNLLMLSLWQQSTI
jgi:asparagine synthase (glutamine-hydrolysing)